MSDYESSLIAHNQLSLITSPFRLFSDTILGVDFTVFEKSGSNAFFFEQEYQQTGPYVFRLSLDFPLIRDTILLLGDSLCFAVVDSGYFHGALFTPLAPC